ncbi:MAG: hypothetical protein IAE83_21945 [Anaerolinea sp.]|nr:hypothetical protein [Anaerolinea sp.]
MWMLIAFFTFWAALVVSVLVPGLGCLAFLIPAAALSLGTRARQVRREERRHQEIMEAMRSRK